jgi:pyruvate/2-oxoglutarate dehydrogenase complex dihydrolipoamide dehydrogenase (E3) component
MSHDDLIVPGAGAAGLAVAARAARGAGRAVALVGKARPGGDCSHHGCAPSKAMLGMAHSVTAARGGQQWGLGSVGEVDVGGPRPDDEVTCRTAGGEPARDALPVSQ